MLFNTRIVMFGSFVQVITHLVDGVFVLWVCCHTGWQTVMDWALVMNTLHITDGLIDERFIPVSLWSVFMQWEKKLSDAAAVQRFANWL